MWKHRNFVQVYVRSRVNGTALTDTRPYGYGRVRGGCGHPPDREPLLKTMRRHHSSTPKMSTSTQLDRLPPTTTVYVIATAILAGVTGYFIGQGASLGLLSSSERKSWPNSYDVRVHRDSSDEDEDEEDETDSEDEGDGGELASFKDNVDEVKLVLVVRTDLGMTKGSSVLVHIR